MSSYLDYLECQRRDLMRARAMRRCMEEYVCAPRYYDPCYPYYYRYYDPYYCYRPVKNIHLTFSRVFQGPIITKDHSL
jgi:hypothetical protein